MAYVSVSPEDWMLAMTLANSNGFPMESLIVPLTLMLWAESDREKINKKKVKVLFIFSILLFSTVILITLKFKSCIFFSRRGRKVFRRERREILLSLCALRLLRELCVKLIFEFFRTRSHVVHHYCGNFPAFPGFFRW